MFLTDYKSASWFKSIATASIVALVGLALVHASWSVEVPIYGPFGPEGPRMREQLWLLPSASHGLSMRATVFQPGEDAPVPNLWAHTSLSDLRRPMVVINHGTSELTRLSVSMPVYYWMSRWFVDRGYVVVLPERRGNGATGGDMVEDVGDCANPDHYKSGENAADDIAVAIDFMVKQPFVDPNGTVVVGVSSGGFASLALASRELPGIRAIINFSGGRGGHAWGVPQSICAPSKLVAAVGAYGKTARVPNLWLYARNDSYFSPELAHSMFEAWVNSGAGGTLQVLPPYGADGHDLADDQAGWTLWGPIVSKFLMGLPPRPQHVVSADPSSSWTRRANTWFVSLN
jgi:dienelactone hydrolase